MKIKPFLKIMLNPFLIKERTSTSIVSHIYKAQANSTTASMKPPNILLYTPGKDSDEANNAITLVKSCLSPNFYTVYPITSAKFYRDPWAENTHTVLIWCSESYFSNHDNLAQVRKSLQNYLKIGGNVLLFNRFSIFNASTITFEPFSKVNEPFSVKTIHGQKESVAAPYYPSHFITDAGELLQPLHQINTEDHSQSVSVLVNDKTCGKLAISMLPLLQNPAHETAGSAVNLLKQLLSSLGLKCIDSSSEISKLDQLSLKLAFLYCNSSSLQEKFITSIRNIPKFQLAPFNDDTSIESFKNFPQNDGSVTLMYSKQNDKNFNKLQVSCSFDQNNYFSNLSSILYGRVVVYADVMPTTMSVFDGLICSKLPPGIGAVAIAKQQTVGKGRSGNQWISPLGCAMFTIVLDIPMNTPLGKCLPFLQLITSAAVVTGIRSIEGLQDVDLTIKWPNDIYHGKQVKLGGVLVQSTMLHDVFYVSIGCGVNIANSMPTVCLNKILRDDYAMQRQLSTEEVIAKTISQLENLIADFQRNGPESFLKLYYKYWLHNLAEVTVQEENGSKVECTVAGVDEFGFLRVRRHDNGEVVTLNPDGNSFDLMKNQIFSKRIKK